MVGLYASSGVGNYVYTKGRILKNFEAAGRIDWKSKKKVYASEDVLFLPLKTGGGQKRSTRRPTQMCYV